MCSIPSAKNFLSIMACPGFKEFGAARDEVVDVGRIVCMPGATYGLVAEDKATVGAAALLPCMYRPPLQRR